MSVYPYVPHNGIALIEITKSIGQLKTVKIHEVDFGKRIYSYRPDPALEARAIDKTFVSSEQNQKLVRLSQEISLLKKPYQTEPLEVIEKDYVLVVQFVPFGRTQVISCEIFLDYHLEKKGKIRELFKLILELEESTVRPR